MEQIEDLFPEFWIITVTQLSVNILWMALFSWGTNFRGFRGGSDRQIPVPTN